MRLLATFLLIAATVPGAALAAPREAAQKVREGVKQFRSGQHAKALAAFNEADKVLPDDLRIAFDRGCALAASGEADKARELLQQASLSPQPEIAVGSRYNLGNLAAAQARKVFGTQPAEATPQQREEGLGLLAQAVSHYRDCLGLDPDHADARHNLELIRLWIKQMEALWKERDRKKQRDEMNLLEMLAMLEKQQRELRLASRTLAAEPDSPQRRQALADLETSERDLADEIEPLEAKIRKTVASSGAAGEALDLLLDQTAKIQGAMLDAADRLHANEPDRAVASQAEAIERLDEIQSALMPFVQLLQRALKSQKGLVEQVDAAVQGEKSTEPLDHEETAWEEDFVARWSERLPGKAEQELRQMEAAPPPADPSNKTPPDPAQAEEIRKQCECVKQALRKAMEIGPDRLRTPASEAAALLKAEKPEEALVRQKESLKLLQEIADLLPPQTKPKQNPQQDQKPKPQPKKDKKDEKQSDSARKPEKPKKPDRSKEPAEQVLRHVRERQRQRQELERQLRLRLGGVDTVEKDW